jgi:hypothetical protein
MNLGSVIRRVQRLFGDDNEVQIHVTDIIDWVNEGIANLARETEFATDVKSTAYDSTTQGFSQPTGFFREKRVTFNDVPLYKSTLGELDSLGVSVTGDSASQPTHFYFWQDKVWLYPQPSASGTLKLWYIFIPNEVSDPDAELPVPAPYHVDLIRFCLARARELDEDYQSANQLYGEVTANMGRSRDEQQNRGNQTFPVVRDDPSDWNY